MHLHECVFVCNFAGDEGEPEWQTRHPMILSLASGEAYKWLTKYLQSQVCTHTRKRTQNSSCPWFTATTLPPHSTTVPPPRPPLQSGIANHQTNTRHAATNDGAWLVNTQAMSPIMNSSHFPNQTSMMWGKKKFWGRKPNIRRKKGKRCLDRECCCKWV